MAITKNTKIFLMYGISFFILFVILLLLSLGNVISYITSILIFVISILIGIGSLFLYNLFIVKKSKEKILKKEILSEDECKVLCNNIMINKYFEYPCNLIDAGSERHGIENTCVYKSIFKGEFKRDILYVILINRENGEIRSKYFIQIEKPEKEIEREIKDMCEKLSSKPKEDVKPDIMRSMTPEGRMIESLTYHKEEKKEEKKEEGELK